MKVPHESKMVLLSEYKKAIRDYYKNKSSRFEPIELDKNTLKVGRWRIDDKFEGPYGREIEQLLEFDPSELKPKEVLTRVREGDAQRYADWREEGLEPPPIEVVETSKGTLQVIDGHRRLAAAKIAGVPVKAWVSWNAACCGGPATGGLTYELAKS